MADQAKSIVCFEVVRVDGDTGRRTTVDSANDAATAYDRCDAARVDAREVRRGNSDGYTVQHPRAVSDRCGR